MSNVFDGDVRLCSWLADGASEPLVEASSGSCLADVSTTGRKVFVAQRPWMPVEPLKSWSSSPPASTGSTLSRTVGILELGQDFLAAARAALSGDEALSRGSISPSTVRALADKAMLSIDRTCVLQVKRTEHEVVHIVAPGSAGTAYDYGAASFVGLHIDNEWIRGEPAEGPENQDFGVVAVNLGTADRFLLFVDRSIAWMGENLGSESAGEVSVEKTKDRYFDAYPNYPVLRVRVQPGQAYFCSPQFVVHDGCANDRGVTDVALLLFGRFQTS